VSDPVLHVLAGPNGAGKTTLYERVIEPVTHLRFVNADRIAAVEWPDEQLAHGYEAAQRAAEERTRLIGERRSFVTETVFSHPSKIDLLTAARRAGYLVTLHVVMVPVDLAVLRVGDRVARGGHDVPEQKIVDRWGRLWTHVAAAVPAADEVFVYDNSDARHPYRRIAHFRNGRPLGRPDWPGWTPEALRALTG
jgi:predicted ABC-type ATPase